MVKLNVKRKLGNVIINIGIQEIHDMDFARQLVEKGLAELIEGVIPEKKKRETATKKEFTETRKIDTPKKKKKG